MLTSLFLSKNQKLVKKWIKEHEKIVMLTHNVIAEYSKNNHKRAKKRLKSLNNLVIDHITDENIKFYQLQKDKQRLSLKHEEAVEEFILTFKDTKSELMNFLTKYSRDSTPLDDDFFEKLNQLTEVLVERINFEEKNLYELLNISKEEEKWERLKREI